MGTLRAFLRDHRTFAILLVAMALCVKVLVPQGYMVGGASKTFTVQLCLDGVTRKAVSLTIPMDGKSHDDGQSQGKDGGHCAFSSLTMGALGGIDTPLLALALAFILALGFAPTTPVLRGRLHFLRPPLRGPPAAL